MTMKCSHAATAIKCAYKEEIYPKIMNSLHAGSFCMLFVICGFFFNKTAKMAQYHSSDYQINWPFSSGEEVQNRFPR